MSQKYADGSKSELPREAVPSRKEAKLSAAIEKRLKSYTLAAGAVGAVLAAPGFAKASIIQISSGLTFDATSQQPSSAFPIFATLGPGVFFSAKWGVGNGTAGGSHLGSYGKAGAGARVFGGILQDAGFGAGVLVGPNAKFSTLDGDNFLDLASFFARTGTFMRRSGGGSRIGGEFFGGASGENIRHPGVLQLRDSGYVGFRFSSSHFGWAHVNMSGFADGAGTGGAASAGLRGTIGPVYYETVQGESILTGQTAESGTAEPPTLFLFALGAAGLAAWRGKKQKAAAAGPR